MVPPCGLNTYTQGMGFPMGWLHRFLSGLNRTSVVSGVSTKIPVAENNRKGTEKPSQHQILPTQKDLMGDGGVEMVDSNHYQGV